MENRQLLNKSEVARRLGVSRPYVYTLINKYGLKTTPDGRIDSIHLEEWISSNGWHNDEKNK